MSGSSPQEHNSMKKRRLEEEEVDDVGFSADDRNVLESIILNPLKSSSEEDAETKRLKREIRSLQKAARLLFWADEENNDVDDIGTESDEDEDHNAEDDLRMALERTLALRKREAYRRSRQILLRTKLPLYLGSTLCIVALGKINTKSEHFHTNRHIYPVGFRSTRKYFSILREGEKMVYRNEIVEQDGKPVFRITSAEFPDLLVENSSARGAWRDIVRRVAIVRTILFVCVCLFLCSRKLYSFTHTHLHTLSLTHTGTT